MCIYLIATPLYKLIDQKQQDTLQKMNNTRSLSGLLLLWDNLKASPLWTFTNLRVMWTFTSISQESVMMEANASAWPGKMHSRGSNGLGGTHTWASCLQRWLKKTQNISQTLQQEETFKNMDAVLQRYKDHLHKYSEQWWCESWRSSYNLIWT